MSEIVATVKIEEDIASDPPRLPAFFYGHSKSGDKILFTAPRGSKLDLGDELKSPFTVYGEQIFQGNTIPLEVKIGAESEEPYQFVFHPADGRDPSTYRLVVDDVGGQHTALEFDFNSADYVLRPHFPLRQPNTEESTTLLVEVKNDLSDEVEIAIDASDQEVPGPVLRLSGGDNVSLVMGGVTLVVKCKLSLLGIIQSGGTAQIEIVIGDPGTGGGGDG